MAVQQIFVNLVVKDLPRAKAFWEALGFSFNPQFTDENGAALILGENIYVMLLTELFFKTFTKKEIADTAKVVEVYNAISVESQEKVDEFVARAVVNGGVESRRPQNLRWMYGRAFEDIDGHTWEVVWMDPAGPPASSMSK